MSGDKKISNKEVMERLQEYFLKQDPAIIARALAGAMIDFNRFYYIDQISDDEEENLFFRLGKNCQGLQEFIEQFILEGSSKDFDMFKIYTYNSEK